MPSRKLKDSHRPLHAACRIHLCLCKAAAIHRCRILSRVPSLARPSAQSSQPMPWTVLRPSFRSCQVEPLTCTSLLRAAESASAGKLPMRCRIRICVLPISALPNSHLRAGCPCLRCRILRQSQFSSAYPPDKAWTVPRPAHVRQQSALPIFPLTNLQPHKSALTISPTDGMAASTLRPCFGQPAEACTSCTFDTVTERVFSFVVLEQQIMAYDKQTLIHLA